MEEKKFKETLDRGMKILDDKMVGLNKNSELDNTNNELRDNINELKAKITNDQNKLNQLEKNIL